MGLSIQNTVSPILKKSSWSQPTVFSVAVVLVPSFALLRSSSGTESRRAGGVRERLPVLFSHHVEGENAVMDFDVANGTPCGCGRSRCPLHSLKRMPCQWFLLLLQKRVCWREGSTAEGLRDAVGAGLPLGRHGARAVGRAEAATLLVAVALMAVAAVVAVVV